MPYFKNNKINLLFIHIPKTGGTSLESYFSSKFNIPLNNKSLFLYITDDFLLNKNLKINSSLQHITFNQIVEYSKIFNIDFDNIKIITIVRNPYDRIISDLFWFKLITTDMSKEEVFDVLNQYLSSDEYDNHNIPQYKFITNNDVKLIQELHILRTESLTDDMKKLGYHDFNHFLNANPNQINYCNYLNNKSIAIINNIYNLDFILFNYDKIT